MNISIIQSSRNEDLKTDMVIRLTSPVDPNNRYAGYIDIEHPNAIKEHPNFLR